MVNAGSSSLKLQVLSGEDEVRAETLVERWSGAEDISGLEKFLATADHVDAVGHRVVHGGTRTASAVVDEALLAEIDALSSLAPLHNPRAVAGIEAVGRVLPGGSPGGLLRHRVPRDDAGGRRHLRRARRLARAATACAATGSTDCPMPMPRGAPRSSCTARSRNCAS